MSFNSILAGVIALAMTATSAANVTVRETALSADVNNIS